MPACHTKPFVLPGVLIEGPQGAEQTSCDYCGSSRIEWRKCKLICADCRQINKSCADL